MIYTEDRKMTEQAPKLREVVFNAREEVDGLPGFCAQEDGVRVKHFPRLNDADEGVMRTEVIKALKWAGKLPENGEARAKVEKGLDSQIAKIRQARIKKQVEAEKYGVA